MCVLCACVCVWADCVLCVRVCMCVCGQTCVFMGMRVHVCVCRVPCGRPAVSQGRGRVLSAQPGQRHLDADSSATCRARGQGSPAVARRPDTRETTGKQPALGAPGFPCGSSVAPHPLRPRSCWDFLWTHGGGGRKSCGGSSGPALLESGSQAEGPFLVGAGRSPAAGSAGWGALGRRSKFPGPSILEEGFREEACISVPAPRYPARPALTLCHTRPQTRLCPLGVATAMLCHRAPRDS